MDDSQSRSSDKRWAAIRQRIGVVSHESEFCRVAPAVQSTERPHHVGGIAVATAIEIGQQNESPGESLDLLPPVAITEDLTPPDERHSEGSSGDPYTTPPPMVGTPPVPNAPKRQVVTGRDPPFSAVEPLSELLVEQNLHGAGAALTNIMGHANEYTTPPPMVGTPPVPNAPKRNAAIHPSVIVPASLSRAQPLERLMQTPNPGIARRVQSTAKSEAPVVPTTLSTNAMTLGTHPPPQHSAAATPAERDEFLSISSLIAEVMEILETPPGH
jgi:hypothetical protein